MGRTWLIWGALLGALAIPVLASLASPLLAWRQPVYILAGVTGVLAMALMVLQPLAMAGTLPGLSPMGARRLHRALGPALVLLVATHVVGLWITSPPDVVDVLLFRSPTPFSLWGVVAMWALFGAAALPVLRKPMHLKWRTWRLWHMSLAAVTVAGVVGHALLIDGTMETLSKFALSLVLLCVTAFTLWRRLRPTR